MPETNAVIDLSHHNGTLDLVAAKNDGIVAIISQYGPTAIVPPDWPTWTLRQYTDGAAGLAPYSVQGVGRCDRNKFNGDSASLQDFWSKAGN